MQTSPVKLWRNQKKISSLIGLTGEIISATTIFVPPSGFEDQAPYIVVLVKLEKGTTIGQLVGGSFQNDIIGAKVKAVLRKTAKADAEGVIPYGIKFRLI